MYAILFYSIPFLFYSILFYSIPLLVILFVLLVTPALLPAQEQEEEQEQEQEEDAPLCNYFSTNLLVLLGCARPVVAQRNRSGRA